MIRGTYVLAEGFNLREEMTSACTAGVAVAVQAIKGTSGNASLSSPILRYCTRHVHHVHPPNLVNIVVTTGFFTFLRWVRHIHYEHSLSVSWTNSQSVRQAAHRVVSMWHQLAHLLIRRDRDLRGGSVFQSDTQSDGLTPNYRVKYIRHRPASRIGCCSPSR